MAAGLLGGFYDLLVGSTRIPELDVVFNRIAEQGKHEELVKNGGIYARFIDSRREAVSWKL